MNHGEYIRIVDGSQTAVMLIHGIAGTPAHFRDLLPVIPEACSVYNILLDGHSKEVEDFGRSSMKKWKAQVKTQLDELLSCHEKVFFVAHSMGALFSVQAAIDHPDRVAGLFLLGVPTRPWVRFSTALTAFRVVSGNRTDRAALDMYNDTGIRLDKRVWKYITWLPRMLELLAECRRIRGVLPQLAVPTLTFQSRTDELVSIRSCKELEGYPYIENTVLNGSGHFSYGEEDLRLLQKRLQEMIQKT